ncbi:hypothetical protein [Streptomyces profundus]|nr:hypothetical protein [Streptomyces sp. MA3_2.13]UED86811.1 hypothetical protein K4G22_23575 [Streptomyces sp. MA3_2.13]
MLEYELHRQRATELESAARDHRRARALRRLMRLARRRVAGFDVDWVTAA